MTAAVRQLPLSADMRMNTFVARARAALLDFCDRVAASDAPIPICDRAATLKRWRVAAEADWMCQGHQQLVQFCRHVRESARVDRQLRLEAARLVDQWGGR